MYFKLRKGGVVWTLIGLEFFQNLQGWLRIGEEEGICIIHKSLIVQIYFVKKSWDIQHYTQCDLVLPKHEISDSSPVNSLTHSPMDSLETIPGDKVTMHTSRSQLEKASVFRPKFDSERGKGKSKWSSQFIPGIRKSSQETSREYLSGQWQSLWHVVCTAGYSRQIYLLSREEET